MSGATVQLPRDTTRQGQGILYGRLARTINRWTGLIILAFVIVHIAVQAFTRVAAFAAVSDEMPWLISIQNVPAVHALVYAAVVFHTLYGLKLVALDLGMRIDYRISFWAITGLSVMVAIRELLRYVGL